MGVGIHWLRVLPLGVALAGCASSAGGTSDASVDAVVDVPVDARDVATADARGDARSDARDAFGARDAADARDAVDVRDAVDADDVSDVPDAVDDEGQDVADADATSLPRPPTPSRTVAAGTNLACAVRNDGSLACWGTYAFGTTYGDARLVSRTVATRVGTFTDVIDVDVDFVACFVRAGGEVDCVGPGNYGALGDATFQDSETPVVVRGVGDALQVRTFGPSVCAVRRSGAVACWGSNSANQLGAGPGSGPIQLFAVDVLGMSNAVSVAMGQWLTCAIDASGGLWCWGDQAPNAVGTPANDTSVASHVADIPGARDVSVSGNAVCVTREVGAPVCFGHNGYGELGLDPSQPPASIPFEAGFGDVRQLSLDTGFGCALGPDGSVACAGLDEAGQLGDESWLMRFVPSPVVGLDGAIEVDVGTSSACARRADGSVWCWGSDQYGQLGDGATVIHSTPADTGISDATLVTGDELTMCALSASRGLLCWGSNLFGQFADGTRFPSGVPAPVPIASDVRSAAAGFDDTCVVASAGTVNCAGWNASGEFGNGTSDPFATGPAMAMGLTDAVEVALNLGTVCARRSTGEVACWGVGQYGELGDGTTTALQPLPVAVLGLSDAVDIDVDLLSACAVRSNGSVACWGNNVLGQLGDGSMLDSAMPVSVVGVTDAVQVSTGGYAACVVLRSGRVQCWGYGEYGQLGDGSTPMMRPTAGYVAGLDDAAEVRCGDAFVCARRAGGQVACWGVGAYGNLGNATTMSMPTPQPVAGIDDAVGLAVADQTACALRAGGVVSCWGFAGRGATGSGNIVERARAAPVIGLP